MGSFSLRWRLIALVLASVLIAQAIGFGVLLLAPPPEPPRMTVAQVARAFSNEALAPEGLERRPATTAPDTESAEPGGTPALIKSLLALDLRLSPRDVSVRMLQPASARAPAGGSPATVVPTMTIMRTGPAPDRPGLPLSVVQARGLGSAQALLRNVPQPPFEAAVRGADGRWTVVGPEQPFLSPWQVRVMAAFALSALVLLPAAWWSAGRLTRPMRLFADAAERLGLDPSSEPLPVTGPSEVRTAAASFNRMQDRLRSYVEGRTAMVAAIAHDLRTPLTGLRLRAETAPPVERARMVEDIGRMESMIAQVLAFVRGEQVREVRERVDLCALAEDCVNEAAERGEPASLSECVPALVNGERLNLTRAIANLVTNAANYGGVARISVERSGDWAVLTVEDDGPGLPPEALETVLEPFRRLEPSRSRSTGGVGLGLASALSIVRAHKGTLSLRNRPQGGLAAEVRLPLLA